MKNVNLTRYVPFDFICKKCKTTGEVEESDLDIDRFKPPGTFWFDGSAGDGVEHVFVRCPGCGNLQFVDDCIDQATLRRLRQRETGH